MLFFSFASSNSAKMKKMRCEFCFTGDFLSSFLTNNIRPPMREGSRGRWCVSQSLTLAHSYRLLLFVVAVWQCVWWLRHLTAINWLSRTAVEILSDIIVRWLVSWEWKEKLGLTVVFGEWLSQCRYSGFLTQSGAKETKCHPFFSGRSRPYYECKVFFGKDQHMASSD